MKAKDVIMAGVFAGGGSGGGGGLPTPTATDVGKTLVVKEIPVPGAVIVPEQTLNCVTPEGEEYAVAVVTDVDASLIAYSDAMLFTFDDTVVETQTIQMDIGDFEEYGFAIQFVWDEEENKFVYFLYAAEAGEHTIKVIQKQARTFDTVIPEQEITVVDPDTPVSLTATEYPIAAGDTVLIEVIYELGTERYYDTLVDNGGYITTSDNLADLWAIGVLFYDNGIWTPAWKGLDDTYNVRISKVTYSVKYGYGYGSAGLKVTASKGVVYEDGRLQFYDDDMSLDKTWAEISSAVESGVPVYLVADIDGLQDTEARAIWQLQSYGYRTNEYMVTFTITTQSGASEATSVASTPDGTLMP